MPYPTPVHPTNMSSPQSILLFIGWWLVLLLISAAVLWVWHRYLSRRQGQASRPRDNGLSAEAPDPDGQSVSKVTITFEVAEGTCTSVTVEALPDTDEVYQGFPAENESPAMVETLPAQTVPPAQVPEEIPAPVPAESVPNPSPGLGSGNSQAVSPTPLSPLPELQPAPRRFQAALAGPTDRLQSSWARLRSVRVLNFLWENRWVVLVALVLVAIAWYIMVFAPTQPKRIIPPSPNSPGRPFFELHFLRDTLSRNYNKVGPLIGLAGGGITLAVLAWYLISRKRQAGEFALLGAALTLAGLGQWELNFSEPKYLSGVILYGTAAVGFIAWAWLARSRLTDILQPSGRWRWEWVLVLVILGVTAYARLYAFPQLPYGVEGDEKNWTSEVVHIMIDGRSDFSGEYHYSGMPVSFYMQMPFHRLFGAGVNSARLAVIFYSILGSLAFFWLLRQIAPLPIAGIGSFLLGVSIADISASRLANVESHTKFFPLLTLTLLAFAIGKRRWEAYLVCGVALALGVLTFDTAAPIFIVALMLAIIELIRQKVPLKNAVTDLVALAAPTILAVPALVSYFEGRLTDYGIAQRWKAGFLPTLSDQFGQVLRSWFVHTESDFIYSRSSGPMINAALLPWLVFGIILALLMIRLRLSYWTLIWAGLVLLPIPTITERPVARVYYPGLPAVYIFIALAMFVFAVEVDRLLGKNLRLIGLTLAFAGLAWIGAFNLFIYFNEVNDPMPRQVIRELGEFIKAGSGPGVHWYIPYQPGANSQIFAEDRTIELFMHGKIPTSEITTAFEMVPFETYLPGLFPASQQWQTVEVVLDHFTDQQKEQGQMVAEAMKRCFPDAQVTPGQYMDRYSLTAAALANPACRPVTVHLAVKNTAAQDTVASPDGSTLTWSLSSGTASTVRQVCEESRSDVVWVEAEELINRGGWQADSNIVMGWQGSGFMFDFSDSRELDYIGPLPPSDQVYAWVRYFKRQLDLSPGYLQIDDQAKPFAALTIKDQLEKWTWERIGPFDLSKGASPVVVSRPFKEDLSHFWAIFIDTIVFTGDAQFSPEKDTPWHLLQDQTAQLDGLASAGEIAFSASTPGRYRCKVSLASAETPLVDAFGKSPVWSNAVEFKLPQEAP